LRCHAAMVVCCHCYQEARAAFIGHAPALSAALAHGSACCCTHPHCLLTGVP
jgi:hypothetical protein